MRLFIILLSAITIFSSCGNKEQEDGNDNILVNQTLETIFKRKSVRTFTNQPVDPETIDLLIRAGMAAPSSRDRRPWEFIVISKREILDSIGEIPTARTLKGAQQAIVVCGDVKKSDNAWFLDCSAAVQNVLLAAESLGLGAVWTAAYPYDDRIAVVREALNLPDHIIPLSVIPIGYPAGQEKPKDKYDPKAIHLNGW